MKCLEKQLGKVLNAKQVAQYLDLDVKTVWKYYQRLGGIRLGRQYRFFEKEICNAISKREKMDSPSEEGRKEGEQIVSNEEGCHRVGDENATKTRQRLEREDRHDIFG